MVPHSRAIRLLLAALPLLAAVLLYGYTIRLPFFLDDGPNFHFVRHIDGLEQWAGSAAFDYYRPLPFSVWKLGEIALGGHSPVAMHLVNVGCFGLTGVLLGLIARRLVPGTPAHKTLAGLIAGLAFVIFPFNYQAVTLVSGLFHLLFALGLALSMWLALRWLDGRGGVLTLLACWIAAFAAAFSHENAPLLAPLMVGLVAVAWLGNRAPPARMAWVVVPVGLIAGLYTLLWFTVPRAGAGEDLLWSNAVRLSLGQLSQGLAYPAVAIAGLFVEGQTVEATRVLLLVAAVVAPVAIWTAWRSREAGAVVVFGVAWYALALIPAALFLAADYVLGSPRLMLVASLGGGLAWGAAGAEIVRATRHLRPRRRWMLWGPLATLPLILALNFLTARRHDFLHLGAFTWRLFDLLDAADIAGQDILIVNAPNYLAPREPTFLLGAEGATFMLNELGYEQPYWLNTGRDFPAARIDALAYRQTVKYPSRSYTPYQGFVEGEELRARLGAATRLFTTQFDDPRFLPVYSGGANLPGADAPLVQFDAVGLAISELEAAFSPARQVVTIRARWRLEQPVPVKYFMHAFCDGDLVGQADGYVWNDLYPFSAWQPGDIQTDIRELWLTGGATPDCLHLLTGVYWEANAERLIAIDAATGEAYVNGLVPIPLARVTDDLIPFQPGE